MNFNNIRLVSYMAAVGVFSVVLTGGVFSVARVDAAPITDGTAIGSVDIHKIEAKYQKEQAMQQQIEEYGQKLQTQMKRQSQSVMLSASEQKTLGDLLALPTPTDAERAQITSLEAKAKKDEDDLIALQQTPTQNLTDAQKTRLQALSTQAVAGKQTLDDMQGTFKDLYDAKRNDLSDKLTVAVQAAISAVAKQHNLGAVFSSDVALYTSNDITDDVLKVLNK